ncbi:serine protease [Kribbella antibiotica]|uniref:Serine protease n=1 Tax=Kribbella antibiotica TaxID=190195 RepID=A0A4R4Z9V1_9ACTN|nr:serine protease [Kribbella antibiotica]TDD54500.1 serine protease [Kribbella antibiotica]
MVAAGDEEDDSVVHDGRSGPRPPRRVPAGAPPLTQLQPTIRRTTPPPRRPWLFGRFLAGLVVLLLVVTGGAAAGWFVRQDRTSINEVKVLADVGSSVVRVLSTACSGTGEGTGVYVGDNLVLTADIAVREPLAAAIVTRDGVIRRANLLGTGPDGVAVLQVVDRLSVPPLQIAASAPDPEAGRALLGYTASGNLAAQTVGSEHRPRPLGEVMNAAKLGGPVFDKSNQVVGMVTGDNLAGSRIVPAATLRALAVRNASGLTPNSGGSCTESRGPQSAVTPVLQVSATELAVQAQRTMTNYLTLQNRHDFAGVRKYYTSRLAGALPLTKDRQGHLTTYFFGATITEITQSDGGVNVRINYVTLFSSDAHGAEGKNCNRLDQRYRLLPSANGLLIDGSSQVTSPRPCDQT